MQFNLRVFISSTSLDLQDYRQAAFKAIQSLGGYSDDMIFWSADEREGATFSVDRVRQCDVVVLIVAHRYGHVPPGSPYSVTEMEYRVAREAGIPVLAFFVDENIPWSPKHIQWEMMERLKQFKQIVESEVTRKAFKSPDELTALVTQSLVAVADRQRQKQKKSRRFTVKTARVDPIAQLKSKPDAFVQIGSAEDDLPLLLAVKRSHDIASRLGEVADAITRSGVHLPEAMFKTFQQTIEHYSVDAWAAQRIFSVDMHDGSREELYVKSSNLSLLFRPLLATILEGRSVRTKRRWGTVDISVIMASHSGPPKELQSVGGQNRFLGLALTTGNVFSVGQQSARWLEWRPFLFESIVSNFPNGSFTISGTQRVTGEIASYSQTINQYALENINEDGRLDAEVYFTVPRQAVGELLIRIATNLSESHKRGKIHGDLKAGNVILAAGQPILIDTFDLNEGELSPGLTPGWSAPEQILGEPVTFATDVYPLGIMVAQLLRGSLVGEVRKFHTPPTIDGRQDFDIFYDPFVHVEPDATVVDEKGLRLWVSFARSCLRFNEEKRMHSAELFEQDLRSLLDEHPLRGEIQISIPAELRAATLVDNNDTLARLISDRVLTEDTDSGSRPALVPLPPPVPSTLW